MTRKECISDIEMKVKEIQKILIEELEIDNSKNISVQKKVLEHTYAILDTLYKQELATKTDKRKLAAEKATATRKAKAQDKMDNAINLLKFEGKEITAYAVAKTAGVHYNTAKKYLELYKDVIFR